jgi:hypothetical protein
VEVHVKPFSDIGPKPNRFKAEKAWDVSPLEIKLITVAFTVNTNPKLAGDAVDGYGEQ